MATIRDVAEHCGVSTATVSAVINSKSWVPEATRERVLASVDAVKYRPNWLARSLKTRHSQAIGVIVSDLTNPFFTEIVRSIAHKLREKDHNLFLCDSDHRYEYGDTNLRMLLEKQIDGLVLVGASVRESALSSYVASDGAVPVIAIERDYDVPNISTILVDSEAAGRTATKHLIENGYSRIAFISGPAAGPGSTTFAQVRSRLGYERAIEEAGRQLREEYIVRGDFRFEGGLVAMRELLALPQPPDAIFAANDVMALGAARVVREAGLRVPQDIGIVGYDDIEAASVVSPSLTTLAVPKHEIGQVAADLILTHIEFGGPAGERKMFTPRLVVRESSVKA